MKNLRDKLRGHHIGYGVGANYEIVARVQNKVLFRVHSSGIAMARDWVFRDLKDRGYR